MEDETPKRAWPQLHTQVATALDVQMAADPPDCSCSDCLIDAALRIAVPLVIEHERERIATNLIELGITSPVSVGRLVRVIREGRL